MIKEFNVLLKSKWILFSEALIILALALLGCSPPVEQKLFPPASLQINPQGQDRILKQSLVLEKNRKVWFPTTTNYSFQGGEFFNTAENLMIAGDATSNVRLRGVGHSLAERFYKVKENSTQATPRQSLYLEAALGQKKDIFISLLHTKIVGIQGSADAIKSGMAVASGIAKQTFAQIDFVTVCDQIKTFLDSLPDLIKEKGAFIDVVHKLRDRIEDYKPRIDKFGQELKLVSLNKSVAENLYHLRSVLTLPLDKKVLDQVQLQLDQTQTLGRKIGAMTNGEQALSALLDIWLMLDTDSRKKYFEPVSKVLFDTLSSKSDADIMLIRDGTWWPRLWLTRAGIIKELNSYGIDKLRFQLDQAVSVAMVTQFKQTLIVQLKNLPTAIQTILFDEMSQTVKTLIDASIPYNYHPFFANLAVKWGSGEIFAGKDVIPGLEGNDFDVTKYSGSDFQVKPAKDASPTRTGSGVIGASLSLATERWTHLPDIESVGYKDTAYFQMVLSALNKIPALGGFWQMDDKLYPSFHLQIGVSDPFANIMDLKQVIHSGDSYAVPDLIELSDSFSMDQKKTLALGPKFSVHSQAELLRGLSNLLIYFKDWSASSFDFRMSRFVLGELKLDVPPALENEPLFPKDKLYEYCLGITNVLLSNLKKDGTGLYLLSNNGQIYSGKQLDEAKKNRSLQALIVDVGLNKKASVAKTSDIARYVLGLKQFLVATDGVENSASSTIQAVVDGKKPNLQELLDAREQIRLLVMAFSNFLSNRIQQKDGGFAAIFSVSDLKMVPGERNLIDQMYAILALSEVSKYLGMDVYRAAAMDGYYFLNRQMWDDKEGFYSSKEGSFVAPTPEEVSLFLRTAGEVREFLTGESRDQADFLLAHFAGQVTGEN